MPLHSALTDANGIHEPKGISTATNGQVYIANGASSGNWKSFPTGWGYYQHSGAAQNITTTNTKLIINGLGTLTNTTYLPAEIRGTGQLWSTTNNRIAPIRLGDAYETRIDLPITARTTATELRISYDISGGTSPTSIILSTYDPVTRTPPHTLSITVPILVTTNTVLTNGIQLFLAVDAGNISITDPSISIIRTHSGDI